MLCILESALNESQMAEIKKFETNFGVNLLAFRCFKSDPAGLDAKNLTKLKELEKELDITLVAIQK